MEVEVYKLTKFTQLMMRETIIWTWLYHAVLSHLPVPPIPVIAPMVSSMSVAASNLQSSKSANDDPRLNLSSTGDKSLIT